MKLLTLNLVFILVLALSLLNLMGNKRNPVPNIPDLGVDDVDVLDGVFNRDAED